MRSPRRLVLWLGAAAPPILAAAAACLPNLTALPPEDSGTPDLAPACGDGVVETLDDGGDAGESCDPGDASPSGCVSCQIACPAGKLDDARAHCYFKVAAQSSFKDADDACEARGGHVVTIGSAREAAIADAVVAGASYWVGLDYRPSASAYLATRESEPGWPGIAGASCSGCFALGADDAGTFPVHPDEDAGGPACVVASNGAWFGVPCSSSRSYETVCEREPLGRRAQFCGGPFCATIPSTAGQKRYVLGLTPVSEEEAKSVCSSYEGGALVMLDTAEERRELVKELLELVPSPLTVWIGLSTDEAGAWQWADGTPADGVTRPLPWGDGQPAGSGPRRAFLRVATGDYDTQLARADDGAGASAVRGYICQRSP